MPRVNDWDQREIDERDAYFTQQAELAEERFAEEEGQPQIGDYVLATKYSDGDPCDHFYVGFVIGMTWHGRFLIGDNDGHSQRANGFRRAEKITESEGRRLVDMFPSIGDIPGPSLWDRLEFIRNTQEEPNQ